MTIKDKISSLVSGTKALRIFSICIAGNLACASLTSCFTGIESTKKVSLTRQDRKALEPTPEEEYFKGVSPQPLSQWKKGKRFMAADNKTALIFNQRGLPTDPDSAMMKGKVLSFSGIEPKREPDGKLSATILFSDPDFTYRYDTGRPLDSAPDEIFSDKIPMLIDLDMVDEAGRLLSGNSFWIRTPIWYDEEGNRIAGRKFVEVKVAEVLPGNLAFPMKLKFLDQEGNQAWLFMNFGISGTETRMFPNLFFLSDIRKNYPAVTDETWEIICRGGVKTGMTKDECKLSLGNPDDVSRGHDYSQTLDLWQYSDGTALWFEDGILTKYRR